MTTARERMIALSGLDGAHTAREHFLAIMQGTGQGTVFASMFAVQIDAPTLSLVQRAKREAAESVERSALRQIDERGDGDVAVRTGTARMSVQTAPEWLTITPQRETQVFIQRDVQSAVVRQSDVVEMN